MPFELLTQIGLSPEQAEIYLSLLENGAQSAAGLSQNTSVKRTYVYRIAEELASKGLVTQGKKGRTTMFSPNSPDFLLNLVKNKQAQMSSAETQLENALPSLKEKYKAVDTRPVVQYFEGESGLKKVFMDIYGTKNEPVYGCAEIEKVNKAIPEYLEKKLIPLRIKNKVEAKSFLTKSKATQKLAQNDSGSLRQSVLLDKEEYPLPAEIDVYEDKIAMLSFKKGRFVGILIENEDLATSIKSIFKLAFDKTKKV